MPCGQTPIMSDIVQYDERNRSFIWTPSIGGSRFADLNYYKLQLLKRLTISPAHGNKADADHRNRYALSWTNVVVTDVPPLTESKRAEIVMRPIENRRVVRQEYFRRQATTTALARGLTPTPDSAHRAAISRASRRVAWFGRASALPLLGRELSLPAASAPRETLHCQLSSCRLQPVRKVRAVRSSSMEGVTPPAPHSRPLMQSGAQASARRGVGK